ncbi:MAG: hypothetical protein IPG56_08670 [Caulobacteraceae bacterium]|nr:hypothetical protein [Caulobacteraceae bacterium]
MAVYETEIAKFEEIGEAAARENLAAGRYGEDRQRWAKSWLESKERARRPDADAEAAANTGRSAADLGACAAAAQQANALAREANTLAKWLSASRYSLRWRRWRRPSPRSADRANEYGVCHQAAV